jgi:hypothetical protein
MKGPLLVRAAEILLDSVKKEIRTDMAKSRGVRGKGERVKLPRGKSFVDSFSFKIRGSSTIEIISTWPTIENYLKGTDSYKMSWLVQPKVKYVPIILGSGEVIIRTAPWTTPPPDKPGARRRKPLKPRPVWIHPGFAKYTFLERGIRKGKQRVVAEMPNEVLKLLLEG